MAEDIGTEGDAGGLDTTISNDMFAGTDIAETMSDAFDSQQESDQPRGGGATLGGGGSHTYRNHQRW